MPVKAKKNQQVHRKKPSKKSVVKVSVEKTVKRALPLCLLPCIQTREKEGAKMTLEKNSVWSTGSIVTSGSGSSDTSVQSAVRIGFNKKAEARSKDRPEKFINKRHR